MFFRKKQKQVETNDEPSTSSAISLALKAHLGLESSDLIQVVISAKEISISLPIPSTLDEATILEVLQERGLIPSGYQCRVASNIPMFAAKQALVTNVKNIVAVSSGKGGVGKSATAVNLALALTKLGARVGILDADIYGPSVPIMLGTTNASPESNDNKTMQPIHAHGMVSNSIGYLVDNEHASIWRGPMASKALQQLVNETKWPLLDYLIVDMPPGTGDIQLTMAQNIPLTAAVVVTTPQDIALSDAGKGIAMFEKLDIPVVGIVENMSFFECPSCHTQSPIFASGGASKLGSRYKLPVLAEVPINMQIRENADNGHSLFADHSNMHLQDIYLDAARSMAANMVNKIKVSQVAIASGGGIDITRLD